MKGAARDFSDSYNYEGSSGDELLAQVGPHVIEEFWSSPRGLQNAESAAQIDEPVVQHTELASWETTGVGAEAAGHATRSFRVDDGDGTEDYEIRHELGLAKGEDGRWRISRAGEPLE